MPISRFTLAFIALCACASFSFAQNNGNKAAPPKLLTKTTQQVIDGHKQLYGMSCIPMTVELILKLTSHAPTNFYDLQNDWQNKSDGTFANFDGKTIKGVTFHRQFTQPRNKDFPLEKLFATIDRELAAGRYVIVSLTSGTGWHMYVICDKTKDGEFIALSKLGGTTITNDAVKRTVKDMKGTDILTYEVRL